MSIEKYINKATVTSFTGGMLLGAALSPGFNTKETHIDTIKDRKQGDDQQNIHSNWRINEDMVYAVVSGIL